MVKQVIHSRCGVRFDPVALRKANIDPESIVLGSSTQQGVEDSEAETGPSLLIPQAEPASPGEGGDTEPVLSRGKGWNLWDKYWSKDDVQARARDQLLAKPLWWLLEFLPMKFIWQDRDGAWKSRWGYVLFIEFHPTTKRILTG